MQSTLVDVNAVAGGGKGTNPKTTLYVGGLEENVNEAILHSAFIPFGDIKDVNIPLDHATGALTCSSLRSWPLTSIDISTQYSCDAAGKHRGFGFIEYEAKDDAADAIDNMHNAELYGRVLRTNYAQPMKIKGGDKGFSHQAVWADADDWYERAEAEQELEKLEDEKRLKDQKAVSDKYTPKDPMQEMEEAILA